MTYNYINLTGITQKFNYFLDVKCSLRSHQIVPQSGTEHLEIQSFIIHLIMFVYIIKGFVIFSEIFTNLHKKLFFQCSD